MRRFPLHDFSWDRCILIITFFSESGSHIDVKYSTTLGTRDTSRDMDLDDDAPPELVDTTVVDDTEEVVTKVPITIVTGNISCICPAVC